jgi:hypothetical protein
VQSSHSSHWLDVADATPLLPALGIMRALPIILILLVSACSHGIQLTPPLNENARLDIPQTNGQECQSYGGAFVRTIKSEGGRIEVPPGVFTVFIKPGLYTVMGVCSAVPRQDGSCEISVWLDTTPPQDSFKVVVEAGDIVQIDCSDEVFSGFVRDAA